MLTYLSLLVSRLKDHPYKVFGTILFPALILLIWLPFISTTLTESQVPIGWVDKDQSEFSKKVLERLKAEEKILTNVQTEVEVKEALQRGELEAAFIIKNGFGEAIKSGVIKNQITWLRTNHSTLDTFIKEKLAAEVMRLALNSKAANTVVLLSDEKSTWEKAFEQSDQYWEPEPLFQMNYERFENNRQYSQGENPSLSLKEKGLISFMIWYCWMVLMLAMISIYDDRNKGILQRIKIYSGSTVSYYLYNFFYRYLIVLLLFLVILTIQGIATSLSPMNWLNLLSSGLIVYTLISIIVFLFVLAIKSRALYLAVMVIYALLSLTVGTLSMNTGVLSIDTIEINLEQFSLLFPHTWLIK